jgi:hypothetical protein
MTISEYKAALESLTEEGFEQFRKDFGGSQTTREQYVRDFVDHPEHERRICQLLGKPTEEEKQTEASISSAKAAKASANSAWCSLVFAVLSVLISVIALLKSCEARSEPTRPTSTVPATDRQIDRLVYDLYGLTDNEIAIVEEATL